MRFSIRVSIAGVALLAAVLATAPAEAGPRLRLGRVQVAGDGSATVPVILVAKRSDRIAALNFTLRYDPSRLQALSQQAVVGTAVERARAELASVTDEAGGTTRVIVLPEFSPTFPVLRGGRVATVSFRLRGPVRGSRERWVRKHVALEGVVFGDNQGREISSSPRPKQD
jgi:hypothetical protein